MKAKLILWLQGLWLKYKSSIIKFGLFIAILGLAYIAGRCSTKEERIAQQVNLEAALSEVAQSSITIDGLKQNVYTKDALILSKDNALQVEIIENKRLRALNIKELVTNAELIGTIKILRDSLKLPPDVQFVTVKDTSGSYPAVRLPFTLLNISESNLSLTAGMRSNKTAYFSLSVPVTGEMSIGYVRAGLFKTKPVGIFTSENPYLKITDMSVLIVKEEKRFFQKTWVHLAAGALIYGIGYHYLK